MESISNASELRIASKLSDVKEDFTWYSLQFPELSRIGPRVGHSIISSNLGKVVMIGGGNHNGSLQEIFSINLEPAASGIDDQDIQNDRIKEHPDKGNFSGRYEFFCAKDSNNIIWIFGGADTGNTFNDVLNITEDKVELIEVLGTQEGPCSRTQGSNSALVEFDGKSCVAVFAGGLKAEQPVNDRDLYMFDIEEHKWEKAKLKLNGGKEAASQVNFECQPPAVQGHAMTAIGSKILVHGGISHVTLYDGYHLLNLENKDESFCHSWIDCSNQCDAKPEARAAHGIGKVADVDKTSSILYIFGGLGPKGPCNDLWSFNADSMGWSQIMKNKGKETYGHYPSPRLDFAMCAVGLQDNDCGNDGARPGALSVYLLIHGGMNEQGELFSDAWVMKVR